MITKTRKLTKRRIAWLIYKRLRTGIGVTLGFVVIYGACTRTLFEQPWTWLPIALGFWLIHLFGDLFNDYCDRNEDVRNKRADKWTTGGVVPAQGVLALSLAFATVGLALLALTTIPIALLGLACAITAVVYSHPRIRLKRYELKGYLAISLPIFLFPIVWNTAFLRTPIIQDVLLGLFFGFHYLYLYCQKDATDLADETNLFIKRGWKRASAVTALFAGLSLLFFATVTFTTPLLTLPWAVLASADASNVYLIAARKTSRSLRSRIVLVKFSVPYIYAIASLVS